MCYCYGDSNMSKITIVLILCGAVFSLVSSAALKREQHLATLDDGSIDWDKLLRTTRTWEPVTWEPVTWEPDTWEPVTWEPDTWEPVTLDPFTWNPITWKPITLKPFNYNYYENTDNSAIYIVVYIIIFVFVAFLLLCLITASVRSCSSSTRNSSRYPPSVVVPTGAMSENTHVVIEFMPHPLLDSNNAVATSSAIDRPPGYDDVLLCDILQENIFPGVKQTVPETPPPSYTPAPNYTPENGTRY